MKEYFTNMSAGMKLLIFGLLTAIAAYFGVTADFSEDADPPPQVEEYAE